MDCMMRLSVDAFQVEMRAGALLIAIYARGRIDRHPSGIQTHSNFFIFLAWMVLCICRRSADLRSARCVLIEQAKNCSATVP
eukprot:scaffold9061_cov140-Skeletonema_dohrnii-CCMP3373.AAC.4